MHTSYANIPKVVTGILRHYLTLLLHTPPKPLPAPKLREQRSLLRGINFRTNSSNLPKSSFLARKEYLVGAFKTGVFLANPEKKGQPRANPMSDPAAMEGMMGMMKGNMAMMVPQTLIMGWINAFFAGFVLCMSNLTRIEAESMMVVRWSLKANAGAVKLPFPLTPQFKSMLQSGVGTRDLDVRWVSSLSWYFLTLFGLQPVYNFILGSNNCKLFLRSTQHPATAFGTLANGTDSGQSNAATNGTDATWCRYVWTTGRS